jgi:hypothetical protein
MTEPSLAKMPDRLARFALPGLGLPCLRPGSPVRYDRRTSDRREWMTYLVTDPPTMAAVAADIDQIGSAISAANAAAAAPTSGPLAPAADEVSAAIAKLCAYGQEYRAVVTQAAAFHNQFTQALAAARTAYAQAEFAGSNALGTLEADAQAMLGGTGAAAAAPPTSPLTSPTTSQFDVAVVMGSNQLRERRPQMGRPQLLVGQLSSDFHSPKLVSAYRCQELDTRHIGEPGRPDSRRHHQTAILAGNSVLVQGYSQSCIIASLEMRDLAAAGNPYPRTNSPSTCWPIP